MWRKYQRLRNTILIQYNLKKTFDIKKKKTYYGSSRLQKPKYIIKDIMDIFKHSWNEMFTLFGKLK